MKNLITSILFCMSLGFCFQAKAQAYPITAGAEDFIISEVMDNSYDFDDNYKDDKMSISLKDKRVNEKGFIDKYHLQTITLDKDLCKRLKLKE